jgi:hypothetical protein
MPPPDDITVYSGFTGEKEMEAAETDWRNAVTVEIKELMYDGEGIYMTYVIDGTAVGLSTYEIIGDLSKFDPDRAPLFTTANIVLVDGTVAVPKEHSVTNEKGLITVTTEYTERGNYVWGPGTLKGLSGRQEMEFQVYLTDAVLDTSRMDEEDFWADVLEAGFISVPIVFDADSNMTGYSHRTRPPFARHSAS